MEVKQREITGVRKEGKGATERGKSKISNFPPASWQPTDMPLSIPAVINTGVPSFSSPAGTDLNPFNVTDMDIRLMVLKFTCIKLHLHYIKLHSTQNFTNFTSVLT